MISIFCTKKLAEYLPEKLEKTTENIELLDRWCANITMINRKKVLVAICADSRFAFVLWGVKKAQLKDLGGLIIDGIKKTFAFYGIRPEIIDQYIPANDSPKIYATSDRKDVARLNRSVMELSYYDFSTPPEEPLPLYLVDDLNHTLITKSARDYDYPINIMLESLERRYQIKPIARAAFVIDAELDLERYVARRTLLVPTSCSFSKLHKIFQTAFGWKDYHLHEFILQSYLKPLHILCMEDNYASMNEPSAFEWDELPVAHLKVGTEFTYLYDFGDSWEVNARVADIIEDFDRPCPSCSLCEGAAPPEDVGGVGGYLDFLDAYQNPDHPEHQAMVDWVGYWESEAPELRFMNARLDHC